MYCSLLIGPGSATQTRASHHTDLNKPMREDTQEHVLDLLRRYDTVIILDDSDSMKRHWAEASARHALSKLAGLATKRDTDGIDIYFINHEIPLLGVKSEAQVEKAMEAIKPRGSTYLGEALDNVLRPYLLKLEQAYARDGEDALKSIKPINFIIITDGMPADTPEDAIIQAARRLDSKEFPLSQVGVSFVQIGNDKEGAEYLQMLDDALEGTRDMVDTTPYFGPVTTDALCKILLGGINRRWDKANPDGSKKRRK
ncbi:hypothetical protein BDN72DRAFT_932306 [Pluteus cervinus]|uniref:Uncharacterized protein n=1 Tax=Pluteus cervinus TaxID=181527 RepID=A0ACD3B2L3_9AGAR|nr:hypothetical protein BDN72DRAFT_932306 [Pluteus cervinus]